MVQKSTGPLFVGKFEKTTALMATRFQRQVKTNKGGRINVSKSGLSQSQKAGAFTFNSRGTVSYNSSVKGLSFRMPMVAFFAFAPIYYTLKVMWWCVALPFKLIGKAMTNRKA